MKKICLTSSALTIPRNIFFLLLVLCFAIKTNAQEVKTICLGESVELNALATNPNITYSWSPSEGLSATTGGIVTASPSITTTYTITRTINEQVNTKTITVKIKEFTTEPANASLCTNATAPLSLTASDATANGRFLIDENFNIGLAPFYENAIPDWTIENTSTGTPNLLTAWSEVHQGGEDNWGIRCIASSQGATLNTRLVSPTFTTVGYENIALTFTHSHNRNTSESVVALEISTDGGLNWEVVRDYNTATFYTTNEYIDLHEYLGLAAVKFRFNYISGSNYSYFGNWQLDNVKVTANNPKAIWSPQTGLFTDALAIIPYTGQEVHQVYTFTDTPINYTAQMQTGACALSASSQINLTEPPTNISIAGADAICMGTSTVLVASGADTYTWSPATGLNTSLGKEVIATPTETTTYTITGTTNGCSTTTTFLVTVHPLPSLNVQSSTLEMCTGQSATLLATGADSYQWTPTTGLNTTTGAEVMATPSETTTYTVTGTTAEGCSAETQITITVNSTAVSVSPSTTICVGESTQLVATGSNYYTWSPSTGLDNNGGDTVTATPLITTTYTVTGTSAFGCTDTQSVTVTVEQPITISTTDNNNLFLGESATLTAQGAQTYSWTPSEGLNTDSGASVTATPSQTTTYTVTGTTANGCSTTAEITISVTAFPNPVITATGPTEFCPALATYLTAAIPGENPALVVGTTSYSIFYPEIADNFTIECWIQTLGNYTVAQGDIWSYKGSLITTSDPNYNSAYTIAVNNGKLVFGYGTDDSQKITSQSNVNTGEWMHVAVTRSRSNGQLKLFINGIEEAALSTSNQELTPVLYAMIGGGNGISGSMDNLRIWNTAKTSSEILQNIDTIYPPQTANLTADFRLDEGTGTVSFDSNSNNYIQLYTEKWSARPQNPESLLWSNGATGALIEVTQTGEYTVTYNKLGNTYTSNAINVSVQPLTVTTEATALTICPGDSTQLNAVASDANAYFSWSPSTGLDNPYVATPIASPLATTTYTVYATTYSGCSSQNTVTIEVKEGISLTAEIPAFCAGGSTTITASGANDFNWSPATGLSAITGAVVTATPTETTTYTVTGTTTEGCSSTKEITIEIKPLEATITAPSTIICNTPLILKANSNFDNPALEFSGDDQAFISTQLTADFTIEFWLKTSQQAPTGSWDNGALIYTALINNTQPLFGVSLNNNKVAFGVNNLTTMQNTTLTSTSVVNSGIWNHVAVTLSKETGQIQLYINGLLENQAIVTDQSTEVYTSAVLGNFNLLPNSFAGSIDDLKFWNTVRTSAQIITSASTSNVYGTPNLVNYFPFNENTGTTVADIINPSFNNTVFGTPTWSSRNNAPLTYLWSTGETTPTIAVATEGTYTVEITRINCNAISSDFAVTAEPLPAVTATATTICKGNSVEITATGGTTYNWFPFSNFYGSMNQMIVVAPEVTTTYTVAINSGTACESIQSITITVDNPITATFDEITICEYTSPVKLTVKGGNGVSIVAAQDFSTGLGDWTITNLENLATSWQIVPNPYALNAFLVNSSNGGMMLVSNSAQEAATNTTLISPLFNTLGLDNAVLSFEILRFPGGSIDTVVSLDISIDGGNTWTTLKSYANMPTFAPENINLSAYLNQANLKIRFQNKTGTGSFWMLDAIQITSSIPGPVSWTPTDGLFTDEAGTVAYLGEPTEVVYAKPINTTVFTATSQNATSCETPITTTITRIPSVVEAGPNQILCSESVPADVALTNSTAEVLKWQKATNPMFTNPTDLYSSTYVLTGSEIGTINSTTYLRAVLNATGCDAYSSYATLQVNTTTWDGNLWSNGTPDFNKKAIIDAPFITNTNIETCQLEITPNGSLLISSNTVVTSNGKITNNANATDFVVEDGAAIIQIQDVQNEGPAAIKINSFPLYRQDYTLWSAPVAQQNLRSFSPQTLFNRFFSYHTATASVGDYFQEIVTSQDALNKVFEPATGYLIRMPNNWTEYLNATIPGVSYPGLFTGVPMNGSVTVSLSNANTGLNLVGNPYPSPISINAFFATNTNIQQTLYFWRKRNGAMGSGYATYNALGIVSAQAEVNGTDMQGIINPGQGFFIAASGATQLTFNNSMRTNNANGTFLKGIAPERHRFWLNLTQNNTTMGQTLVGYVSEATAGIDNGWDGAYFNDSTIALTSLINGNEYAIQSLNLPFDAATTVPLGFKTSVPGTYTITLSNFDGIFSGDQEIFIKDNVTGVIQNLKTEPYSFSTESGTFNSRFSVLYQSTLAVDHPTKELNTITIYKQQEKLYIDAGTTRMAKVELFDSRGSLIKIVENINSSKTVITDVNVQNQVLLVKITSTEQVVTTKKVMY